MNTPEKPRNLPDDFLEAPQKNDPAMPDRDHLRRLFHSPRFGQSDGLEEYGGDYRVFEKPAAAVIAAGLHRRSRNAIRSISVEQPASVSLSEQVAYPVPFSGTEVALDAAPIQLISNGRTLVIGNDPLEVMECARRLSAELNCFLLVDDPASVSSSERVSQPELLRGSDIRIEGYLGRFSVSACIQEKDTSLNRLLGDRAPYFDLVLDLRSQAESGYELMPLGYYAPNGDKGDLERILIELPKMTGVFEKPRLVGYREDICAHGWSGRTACNRCRDVCPTDAIQAAADEIRIDHTACVGCGLCSTICPTGALHCLHTPADDLLVDIQGRLAEERFEQNSAPTVVFHASGSDNIPEDKYSHCLEQPQLCFPVSEIGCVGPEIWLSTLAYGAGRVVLKSPQHYPSSLGRALTGQIEWVAAILQGIGLDPGRIRLDGAVAAGPLTSTPHEVKWVPAEFAPFQSKRTLIRRSVAHLAMACRSSARTVDLPAGTPFGGVILNKEDCTLCMACAGACPTSALGTAGDSPALHLAESECIQCGLCSRICPEHALQLQPRMNLDYDRSEFPQVLHSEKPLACISCGKPFAAPQLVEKLVSRLHGHWMYAKESEIRRLKMCRDCRVQDFFLDREQEDTP